MSQNGRPLLRAVAAQQQTIEQLKHQVDVLRLQVTAISALAGVTDEMNDIRKTADLENPAQPVEEPPAQPATQTTEEAVTPDSNDDPQRQGQTGGVAGQVSADAVDTPLTPGVSIPTSATTNLVDVTAPVAGTQTQIAPEQTRLETDVRVGNPDSPDVAFPWTLASKSENRNRTFAALKLARLRIEAKLVDGDDLEVAASIESDKNATDHDIAREIEVLSSLQANARKAHRPAHLVPTTASKIEGTSASPSFSGERRSTAPVQSDDASDIFL